LPGFVWRRFDHCPERVSRIGSVVVPEKTNEIPAVRDLCERLDVQGRLVSIDALHTQTQTARLVVLAPGADYLLTVKANQPGPRLNTGMAD